MTTVIDYALMAGASYISNRDIKNQFPTPNEWTSFFRVPNNPDFPKFTNASGFEAISFIKGNEIVISYAGTDFSSLSTDFYYGNIPLALGNLSDQLRQAADYYLQIKQFNPGAAITFTGHSLGAGLASLMAVLFDENAYTFDQAPFRATAKGRTVANPDGSVVTRSRLWGQVFHCEIATLIQLHNPANACASQRVRIRVGADRPQRYISLIL